MNLLFWETFRSACTFGSRVSPKRGRPASWALATLNRVGGDFRFWRFKEDITLGSFVLVLYKTWIICWHRFQDEESKIYVIQKLYVMTKLWCGPDHHKNTIMWSKQQVYDVLLRFVCFCVEETTEESNILLIQQKVKPGLQHTVTKNKEQAMQTRSMFLSQWESRLPIEELCNQRWFWSKAWYKMTKPGQSTCQ